MSLWSSIAGTSPTAEGGRAFVLPAPGGALTVAWQDARETVRRAPVWLHSGWIDVIWRFRRTKLGAFWHTLGLGAFVLTMGVIWSTILHQNPFDYFRYVTASLVTWTLIASFITDGTGILVAGQATALSMRFPLMAFAFAHVWRALLLFAHHFLLYLFVMAITLTWPGAPVLLAAPALLLIALNGIWMSLLAGMLCLRWRDLMPATSTAMQIALFVTPVFWPVNLLGDGLAWAAELNPLYHMVRIIREPLLGGVPPLGSWLWVSGTLVVGGAFTVWLYGRKRDRMPYWF